MRLIVTLGALLIVGFLVLKQLQAPSDSAVVEATSGSAVPTVPTRPQDVPQFDQDINEFIDQSNQDQARQIDEAMGQ